MLTMMLQGRRHPGHALARRLCDQLGLNQKEAFYFHDLVELQRYRVKDSVRSLQVAERLASQRPSGEFHQLNREVFAAISRWYYYAIREMVKLPSFIEDAAWIARSLQFRVTPSEVRDAIRTLIRIGLLARDSSGVLRSTGGRTETHSEIADEGIRRFHEQALENARLSVRKHDVSLRELRGTTLAIPLSRLPEVRNFFLEMHQNFIQLFETAQGDAVYQLEVAFYPISIPGERENDKAH